MKILVLSDSHGQFSAMEDAVLRERPDYIFHLGDHQRDARKLGKRFPDYPVISVPGNCDLPLPTETLTVRQELGGVSMLLTHGHAYGVKGGLLRMELAAQEAGVQVAAFGHTHVAYCQETNGLWMLNPGSIGYGGSYGVILIENGQAQCYTDHVQ